MKWDSNNIRYAKRLIDKGFSRKDVAKKMGVSANALYVALHRFNLKEKQPNKKELRTSEINMMFKEGVSPYLIKEKTGLSLKVIRETARNMGIVNY